MNVIRLSSSCVVCSAPSRNDLCSGCAKVVQELKNLDSKAATGFFRPVELGESDSFSIEPMGNGYMVMITKIKGGTDSYFHGNIEECTTFIEDLQLKQLCRVYMTLKAEDEAEADRKAYDESFSYWFECECGSCGAPTGAGLYQVSRETFNEASGRVYSDSQNISWREMGMSKPEGRLQVKTRYSRCFDCSYE